MRRRLWDPNRLTPSADSADRAPGAPGPETKSPLPAPSASLSTPVIQRKCACGGSCPKCMEEAQMKRPGDSGDHLERQADQVAREAVRGGGPAVPAAPVTGELPSAAADPAGSAGGKPLGPSDRGFFEARLGHDLGNVRIHADAEAAGAARSQGALAYTVGSDIVFGAGQYDPSSPAGKELLAHELAHVVQQRAAGPQVQKQEEPQGGNTAATPASATGTPADLQFFLYNPALETDTGLRTAIQALDRYSAQVRLDQVEFRVMSETDRASRLATLPTEDGRSFWEGNTPVIELPQDKYDTVKRHSDAGGLIHETHGVVRTIGHEMYHLFREKDGNRGNPVQPVYAAEASRRMDEIHRNWLDWIRGGGAAARHEFSLPRGADPQRFEDLPRDAQDQINRGAERTDYIEGFYQRTAYLVEEILVKIEELTFLRIEQRSETAPGASRGEVSQLARLIYLLSVNLDNSVAAEPGVMTPQLLARTRAAMLDFLRTRYPNRGNPAYDSYEVIFYLSAIRGGLPPIYSNGLLISVVPEGARVPQPSP